MSTIGSILKHCLLAAPLIVGTTQAEAAFGVSTYSITVPHDANQDLDMARWYKIYVPQHLQPVDGKVPVVIVLHGGNLNYNEVLYPYTYNGKLLDPTSVWSEATDSSYSSLADQYGFIVAAPNGVDGSSLDGNTGGYTFANGQHWNDCTGFNNGYREALNLQGLQTQTDGIPDFRHSTDDVAFIAAMISDIPNHLTDTGVTVDPKRIFVAGASNGGNMALRLARELPAQIAAVGASLAGDGAGAWQMPGTPPSDTNLDWLDTCPASKDWQSTSQRVAIMLIKGTADHWIEYNGSPSTGNCTSYAKGCWLPYSETIHNILSRYGYADGAYSSHVNYPDPTNSIPVDCYNYSGSSLGLNYQSDVVDCRANGGGYGPQ
jgi:poly(3-hydroxybutyrate) depolymerase